MFHDHVSFFISTYIMVLVNKLLNPFVYIYDYLFYIIPKKKNVFFFFSCLLLFVYYSFVCILVYVVVFFLLKGGADHNAQIDKEIINSNTHADIYIYSLLYFMFISFDFFFLSDVYRRQNFVFFSLSFRDLIKIFKKKIIA
jgi:hypothetical protein